jgi:RNA polymerase sigma-32 factor
MTRSSARRSNPADGKALPPRREEGLSRGLVPYDPLRAYLADVARHPFLSPEEEHALAVRYVETGDATAASRLATAHLRLVVKIAREHRRRSFPLMDLIQEGNTGLVRAVKKYDPFRGVKLSSYAAWWIRAYILRFVIDNWSLVKLGTTQAKRKIFFRLTSERDRLLARGIEPTPRLLARNLRVQERDVEEMTGRMAAEDLSLNPPVARGDECGRETHLDRLVDTGSSPDDALGERQVNRLLRERFEAFGANLTDELERFIFERRLLPPRGDDPLTLQQVGARFRLSRERARQVEARLVSRLRDQLRSDIPDFELMAG